MACTSYVLSGMARGCKDSFGGITKVWLGVAEDSSITIDASTHTADVSTGNLKVYNFRKNTGSMTSSLNYNENAGNSFTTEIALQFLKQDTAKRVEIMGVLMNETIAVVKDANKKYWLVGDKDNPVEGTAGTAETGTAGTDLNGYNITLAADSAEFPYEIVDEDTIASLEAIVVA